MSVLVGRRHEGKPATEFFTVGLVELAHLLVFPRSCPGGSSSHAIRFLFTQAVLFLQCVSMQHLEQRTPSLPQMSSPLFLRRLWVSVGCRENAICESLNISALLLGVTRLPLGCLFTVSGPSQKSF